MPSAERAPRIVFDRATTRVDRHLGRYERFSHHRRLLFPMRPTRLALGWRRWCDTRLFRYLSPVAKFQEQKMINQLWGPFINLVGDGGYAAWTFGDWVTLKFGNLVIFAIALVLFGAGMFINLPQRMDPPQ